jgi:hypothetical protein
MNIPVKTIERWIALLKRDKKIEYRGSKKNGGYYNICRLYRVGQLQNN